MAAYPCARCDQRFDGQAKNAYLTVFEGDEKAAFRYVICGSCLEALSEEWVARALHRNQDGDWEASSKDDVLVGLFFSTQPARNGSKSRW